MKTDSSRHISIALPAFKGYYLKEAICSLLNQTYSDFELIIVDDASPEHLDEIVKQFSDPRIRYFRNEKNIGSISLVQNWNLALSYARFEYFVLASDDDIYHPLFLERLIELSVKYPDVEVFRSRVSIIDSEGAIRHETSQSPEWESCLDLIENRICGKREMFVPEFLCKTKALKNIGGFVDFPCAWGSDSATWYSLSKKNGIVCCNDVLFSFRMSGINISSGGHILKKLKALDLYCLWLTKFIAGLPDETKKTSKYQKIAASIIPYFKNQKVKILTYTPVNSLISFIPKVSYKNQRFIFKAIWEKFRAKLK
ncbi:MAG: glycosyltransferase family 2 protein [Bacteroidales bacterium]|nr:glycosyltransferase family 2 protein [Bacteroidales bacterium]